MSRIMIVNTIARTIKVNTIKRPDSSTAVALFINNWILVVGSEAQGVCLGPVQSLGWTPEDSSFLLCGVRVCICSQLTTKDSCDFLPSEGIRLSCCFRIRQTTGSLLWKLILMHRYVEESRIWSGFNYALYYDEWRDYEVDIKETDISMFISEN